LRITAKLFYDNNTNEDFKPVEYLKQEPMTYKVFITNDKVTLEFRVLCLSSQHEDSCFRIKISVASADIAVPLEVTSDPIRIVSKASQAQKEKRIASTKVPNVTEPESPSSSTKLSGNKRSASSSCSNDIVQETLLRLEQQQQEQRIMIEQILATQQRGTIIPKQEPEDFESAFTNFLKAYRNLPCEDRPNKIRKVVNDSAAVNYSDLSAR